MARLSHWYGRLLEALMLLACLLLLTMTFLIGADVLLRNIGLGGVAPSNEISEDIIYLLTLLAAPGLLRQGQHIRIDIVLRTAARHRLRVRCARGLPDWGGCLSGSATLSAWFAAFTSSGTERASRRQASRAARFQSRR